MDAMSSDNLSGVCSWCGAPVTWDSFASVPRLRFVGKMLRCC